MIENDSFVVVRNIPVRKEFIRKLKENFGAKLVTDPDMLLKLDAELEKFIQTTGQEPDINFHAFQFPGDTNFYKYAPLPIPMSMVVPGMKTVLKSNRKPIWFSIPRKF